MMNMVLWAKVSTDLFVIFALFLLADKTGADDVPVAFPQKNAAR